MGQDPALAQRKALPYICASKSESYDHERFRIETEER